MATFAPELTDRLAWPGRTQAVRMAELRGAPTLLLFGCASSAWTRQRLDDISRLLRRHGGAINAAALLAPRFDSERDPRSLQRIQSEHALTYPVALDADWVAWQQFGIESWPTLVLLDVDGRERRRVVGAGPVAELAELIQGLLAEAPQAPAKPKPTDSGQRSLAPELPLSFPTALVVTANKLYLADTGHHRILECDLNGRILRQFGSGAYDFLDGGASVAAFRRPQGLALQRETLFVADTGNHALRRIDLLSGEVATLCGNGESPSQAGTAMIDQPCGLQASPSHLYVAMSGDNRICAYDLSRGALETIAGSGNFAINDGSGIFAAFAQPTALALRQDVLYVCDAAGSAIRALYLRDQRVQTLVGQGPYDFGQVDGPRSIARLQWPRAIALDPHDPLLWIADAGNDRICTLRLGGGMVSQHNLPQRLHHPGGIACAQDALWIADSGAHAVLRLDNRDGTLRHVPVGE
ncbi:hypothetical protein IP90_00624 [Luteimonas cucumeris]|uniref:NHL repeat-containing protein n=1 Tax=Luteimonas cucumeris TaxID=985012 RepID=A0A562LA39_9GAMM|nr:hypothetical protein [Luteimonas cucumeris]TWI04491.1 hypothetical protein IP90_00624 [Luteimonas cucumeris]